MMKTGPNTQKHVRTLQQHIFSLQFTCTVLTIRLFSKKKSSIYHTASIYFHGLSTLFAQVYSDLQELYNQLLSIDQRQCVFDSDKCEFICFDEIQSMNKKLIIKMKKSLMKDFQQLQVQNFQLQEKQKSLLKVIEDKQRQLQEQLLVSKKSKIQSNNTKTPIYPRNMITQSSFRNIMQINWIEFFQSTSADDLKTCLSTQSNRFSSCESKHPTNFNHFQRQNQSIKYEDNKESYFDQETFLEDQQMPKPYQSNEEKKKIAQSFIYHGYGQTILKQIIKNPSISITRYNNIITTIMKITFRAIQSTARQLNEPILQLLDLEQKLRTALVNCRRWLPKEDLQIFYGFMKVSFGIGLVKISVEGTCRLYKEIKEHLQRLSAQDPVYRKNKAARKKRGVKNYK